MSWTSEYLNPLGTAQVAHFFRRAAFGASPQQLKAYSGLKATQLLDAVMNGAPGLLPLNDSVTGTFHNRPFGYPETDSAKQNTLDTQRRALLKQWWLGMMLDPARGFTEKLVLFWQNHFVVGASTVQDVRYLYYYLATIRRHALGDFKAFLTDITKDPAMLRYLNGNENVVGKPNENYARELFELFALGRGHYSETDIREAARVLTGWRAANYRNSTQPEVYSFFSVTHHDTSAKRFSGKFSHKVIEGRTGSSAGGEELAELLTMILAHPESARFIVCKLYRWYFRAEISAEVEKNFIGPLAEEFWKDFQLESLIRKMLTSEHFFDEQMRGAQIRSPLDIILGSFLALGAYLPAADKERPVYEGLTGNLLKKSRLMEMEVLDQPTVFGWRPYYDTGFYKIWINGTTLGLRGELTDTLVLSSKSQGFQTNLAEWVSFVSNPGDPVTMVREVWTLLMAVELPQTQLDTLVDEVLMDGLPRYEWTGIWLAYTAKRTDSKAYQDVRQKLIPLLTYILRLAEYQLA